jgi:hypothetical protein
MKIQEKIDRKTLSTQAHILLAQLVEEDNYTTRARKILVLMRIIKEME